MFGLFNKSVFVFFCFGGGGRSDLVIREGSAEQWGIGTTLLDSLGTTYNFRDPLLHSQVYRGFPKLGVPFWGSPY